MPPAVPPTDPDLDLGRRAHFVDPAYYTWAYRHRVADVAFYRGAAVGAGTVLEYGVGNGRIALPLARNGHRVTGVDLCAALLRDLEARLAAEAPEVAARISLRHGDMRAVRLRRRFDRVFCTFNTAAHLYTRADAEAFLAGVRAHLAEGGRFVLDLSMPRLDEMQLRVRPWRGPRFRHPSTGEKVAYTEVFEYDRLRQVLTVQMIFTPVGAPERAWRTPLCHRIWHPQEVEALLVHNGFRVEAVHGSFAGEPLTEESDVMIWVASRAGRRAPSSARGAG